MTGLTYNFRQISNSSAPNFSTFAPNIFANSSINNEGFVDYEGFFGTTTEHLPPSTIYSGNGDGLSTVLVDPSIYSFPGNNSSIFYSSSSNNTGTTVFAASGYNLGQEQVQASGPTAVLTYTNGSINTVGYSSTPFVTVARNSNVSILDPTNQIAVGQFFSAPGINDNGTVAYIGGNSDGTSSLYATTSSGDTTTITDTSGPLRDFLIGGLDVGRGEGPFGKYTLPSINNNGVVAFNAELDAGGRGIFSGSGGEVTPIITTTEYGPFNYLSAPSINNSGTVAFNAGFRTGGGAILESINGNLNTVVDTSNGYFTNFRSDVALNQQGQVAFLADYDGGTGIFTGSRDSGFNEVISVGDSIGGLTVQQLFISHRGLNDNGQLSFDAVLGDGIIHNVFRADPVAVPESNSSALFALAILALVGVRWRHRKQSAKDAQH